MVIIMKRKNLMRVRNLAVSLVLAISVIFSSSIAFATTVKSYKNSKGVYCVQIDKKIYEGGSKAWRNNNPGNLKYGDFAKGAGSIGEDYSGFAIFSSYDDGFKALKKLLKTDTYQKLTLEEAIKRYAPESDNNDTKKYIKDVVDGTRFSKDTKLSSLSDDQITKLANVIKKLEGYSAGTIVNV